MSRVKNRWDGGEFVRIGGLPIVARLGNDNDGPIHVFPVEGGRRPIAGPFKHNRAARLWVVEHLEGLLKPAALDVWRQVAALLPPPSDFGLELGLIDMCRRGRTLEQIVRYIPKPDRRAVDRRALAAGDRTVPV